MTARIGVSYLRNDRSGENYLAAVRAAGAEPVVLASETSLPQWPPAEESTRIFDPTNQAICRLDDLDGLLLTGGGDIDPMLYHEILDGAQPPNWPRDHVETAQFHRARSLGLPIFGICRGFQFINVALGGSLIQHLQHADDHHVSTWTASASHLIRVDGDSALARIIAEGPPGRDLIVGVNSRHHQGVSPDRLAPGLIATATSRVEPEGSPELIEAFESEGTREGREYLVGVQWHPERVGDEAPLGPAQPAPFRDVSRRLIKAFVAAAEGARSRNERRELVAL